MTKRMFVIVFCIFLIQCQNDNSGSKATINNTKNPPIANSKPSFSGPIVVFGDSIAMGLGASSEEKSLIGCFREAKKQNNMVINLGNEGETTRTALTRLNELNQYQASAIVISLGGNDVLEDISNTFPFTEKETFENISKLYKELIKSRALVVQIGISPPFMEAKRLPKIKQIAEKHGVLYISESMKNMWNNPRYMSDAVHPNDLGYSLLCSRVIKAMQKHYKF
ncbi:MAG: hypothetical protein KDD58_05015 [Bdellovibrionales bacterium]|nr:hypothetical protein [Bdellovibrionales bacterium]